MRDIINGRPTRINPNSIAIQWFERFRLPGKCIK